MADAAKISRPAAAAAIALGLIAGLLSGWWAISRGMGQTDYSGWHGSAVTGSVDAGPWLRASVSVSGLLALNKTQALYFTRARDDAGEPLREACRYRVDGAALPGKWWSVTVYAADNYLPMNDDDALSFDATEVKSDAAERWSAILASSRPGDGAWASTRNAGQFDITLRIYLPSRAAQANFATIAMPTVTRLDCGDKT